MDALAHLALMTKAKLVFESPGTFLSFPALSPISYKAADLKFGATDLSGAQHLLMLSEFSRVVNSLPRGTIFQQDSDRYLWETYSELLRTAVVAKEIPNPTGDDEYQKAKAFLTVTDADGLSSDSSASTAYKAHRDAWFKVNEEYKTEQSTALAATDPAVGVRWNTVDEPRLRALVQQAENDWEVNGFKIAVEQAIQIQRAHEARSPQAAWRTWSSLFDPAIDLATDLSQQEFALTAFSPSDAFDEEWPTFHLTSAEIAQLVARAPTELKDIFNSSNTVSTVDTLSFEYRSVSITRPWFRPAVFDARFWKLPDGTVPLSDGQDLPAGSWPAYVTALVFVRNINVGMRNSASPTPARALQPQQFRVLPSLVKEQIKFRPMIAVARPPGIKPAVADPRGAPIVRNAPVMNRISAVPLVRGPAVRPGGAAPTPARPVGANAILRLNAANFQRVPANEVRMLTPQRAIVRRFPSPAPKPPVVPPPRPVDNSQPHAKQDDISILAFICKRLPLCPNPDPSLTW